MGNHTFLSGIKLGVLAFAASGLFYGSKLYAGPILQGSGGCTFQDMQFPKFDPFTGQQICSGVAPKNEESYVPWASADAKAKDMGKNQKRKSAATNKYAGMDCNMGPRVPFTMLNYVEINFAERLNKSPGAKCTVVSGSTDAQARQFCKGYLINPGNPQYISSGGDSGVKGDISWNNLGYYFCITGADFNKERMCNEMRKNHPNLSVSFERIGGDGNCMCGSTKSLHKVDCSQKSLASVAAAEPEDKCKENPGMIANPDAATKAQKACVCDGTEGFKEVAGSQGVKCEKAAVASAPNAASGDISPALIECVEFYSKQASSCETAAATAKKSCDEKNKENSEVSKSMSSTGTIANLFINQKVGTGMITECIRAGAIARSPEVILESMRETCEENFKECSNSCGEDKVQEYTKKCGDIANQAADADLKQKGILVRDNKNVRHYLDNLEAIKQKQEGGTKICKVDAANNRGILSSVLEGLGKSVAAAQKCACQMASSAMGTAQSTCDSLPTSADCAANPSLAGCPAVLSVDICSPGSQNYSYQGCKCQQDPKAVGCPQYAAANPGLSGFAGMDIGSGSGGAAVSFGGPNSGGGPSPGDLNLNGNTGIDAASGNKTPGITTGFPTGGSGGGGGGGLGGGGGGAPEAAAAGEDGDGKGGLGGAFGLAKTMANSLFGTGGAKKNDPSSKGRMGSKFDPNKFRPNRGLAQEYGTGNKNDELWQLMHDGYESNLPTFIPNP